MRGIIQQYSAVLQCRGFGIATVYDVCQLPNTFITLGSKSRGYRQATSLICGKDG